MPNPRENPTASVVSLWRYPVKSMMGEEVNAASISERGLLGDRAYAVVDEENGRIVSAKNPRKWKSMFDFRATFGDPPLAGASLPPAWITFPDGPVVSSAQPAINSLLSRALGRSVALKPSGPDKPVIEEYWPDIDGLARRDVVTEEHIAALTPPGTFFDYAPVHLLTTSTMDRLRASYPQGRFEVRRFRPNIVLRPASVEAGFVENDWVGKTLALGSEVRLKITDPCPRCVMTTLAQGDLPSDNGILRAAAQHNKLLFPVFGVAMPCVGIYATVVRGGTVRRGDSVSIE